VAIVRIIAVLYDIMLDEYVDHAIHLLLPFATHAMVRGGNELQGCSHKSVSTWSSKGGKVAGLRWTVELNVALNSRVNLRRESWTP
jgi:hypothetical protein